MANNAVGGTIIVRVNGQTMRAKGNWNYNLGLPKKEAIVGADSVHGYKTMPQVAFIEGATTDRGDLNLADLVNADDATVTLDLANGKTIGLFEAWFAGDGAGSTEEGEFAVRFESAQPAEVLVA